MSVLVFVLLDPAAPIVYQLLPLAASVVIVGLPHGAVDHLAVPRTMDRPVTARWLAAIGALYLFVGGGYAVIWFFEPVAAFAFFILLTWAHWGQGELYPLLTLAGITHLNGVAERALTGATRGALPMFVPLVFFPDQYALVTTTIVGLFDPTAAETLMAAFTVEARLAVAAALTGLVGLTLGLGARSVVLGSSDRTGWFLDVGETLLLVVFFATVPPLLAVGLYFCFWHSSRHVVRLIAVDDVAATALDQRRYLTAVARFARDAAPLTTLALALLVGLLFLLPSPAETPLELVGAYLVLIAALTLPHTVVVAWMDKEQAVWIRTDT